jgi:hypothetical protein
MSAPMPACSEACGVMRTSLAATNASGRLDTTVGAISGGPGVPVTMTPQSRPADMNRSYMP